MQISARKKDWPKEQPSVSIDFPLPADFDSLVASYTPAVVYSKACDSIVIDVQAAMRRVLSNPKTTQAEKDTALAAIANYKPSAGSAIRRSPTEKASDLIAKMSPEEKKALIDSLKASLKA